MGTWAAKVGGDVVKPSQVSAPARKADEVREGVAAARGGALDSNIVEHPTLPPPTSAQMHAAWTARHGEFAPYDPVKAFLLAQSVMARARAGQ